ncbi:uncharacterized protein LOC128857568 [Anastrepha ludens]|uniref:uncharacterized protein LOC128857568 n=1 Tax=Anastrepha ludens TaxID=28586 RepID=UPI0023B1A9E8|nr:uncharacterized protein LOC128857568 [Anastrepha ludens]
MLISPKAKRKKVNKEASFPLLSDVTQNHNCNDPKFIIIKSTDVSNSLSKYSVFAKKKAIDGISTEYLSVSLLRDGSLLILTKSLKVAEKFIKCKNFGGLCPVSVTLHEALNTCKGTIFDKNLANTDEKEILEALNSQGVVGIFKFTKTINNIKVPTGRIVLSFNLYKVPLTIDIAWYSVKVEEYFPTPMRCRSCQLLGHTIKRCNNNTTCEICNFPPHSTLPCQRTMCANCFGPHPATARDCPKYLQEKEVLKIKTQNKCSYAEARRLYKQQNPINLSQMQSYSSVLNSTQVSHHNIAHNSMDRTSSNSTAVATQPLNTTNQSDTSTNTSLSSSHSISQHSLDHIHTPSIAITTSTPQSQYLSANSNDQNNIHSTANIRSTSPIHSPTTPTISTMDCIQNNNNYETNASTTHSNQFSVHQSNPLTTPYNSYNTANTESNTHSNTIPQSLLTTISEMHNTTTPWELQEPEL